MVPEGRGATTGGRSSLWAAPVVVVALLGGSGLAW